MKKLLLIALLSFTGLQAQSFDFSCPISGIYEGTFYSAFSGSQDVDPQTCVWNAGYEFRFHIENDVVYDLSFLGLGEEEWLECDCDDPQLAIPVWSLFETSYGLQLTLRNGEYCWSNFIVKKIN